MIGLAFSDPYLAMLSVDKDTNDVIVYPSHVKIDDLLKASTKRRVLFVTGVRNLSKILPEANKFQSIVVFDDPEILTRINGIDVLDCSGFDNSRNTFVHIRVVPEKWTEAINSSPNLDIDVESALMSVRDRVNSITLQDMIERIDVPQQMRQAFIRNACLYCVRAISKTEWVNNTRDKCLAQGVNFERLAEIEKFVDLSPECDSLWRSYYDHVENQISLSECLSLYGHNNNDIRFLIDILGSTKGERDYVIFPTDVKSVKVKIARKKKVKQPKKTHKSEDYNY